MRKVVVLSGISGSGKSTYAEKLRSDLNKVDWNAYTAVVSADDHFMKEGVYNFDPTKLSIAHGECFHNFIIHMRHLAGLVIVDNTNTTNEEISPYMLGAQAFGYEAEIHTIVPVLNSVDERREYAERCASRNKHGVPFNTTLSQLTRLYDRRLPTWWKNTDLVDIS